MKVLILGNGLLGSELAEQSKFNVLSRKEHGFDITDKSTYYLMTKLEFGAVQYCDYDVIIN